MDFYAVAQALAARYDPAIATIVPPSGELQIRDATAEAPVALGSTPAVVVMLDPGSEFSFGAQTRTGKARYAVLFYLEELGDLERQMVRLEKWAGVLLDLPLQAVHLGIPTLVAMTWSARLTVGVLEYAGTTYAGIRIDVDVTTTEGISPQP